MDDKELSIVTEVGVFGELGIKDPTAKKIKKKNKLGMEVEEENVEELIRESIVTNKNVKSK